MKQGLQPGISGESTQSTTLEMGVTPFGEEGPRLFSTPAMIGLMEDAAIRALRPYLDEGESSVGVRVEVSHIAATPIGQKVRAKATLIRLEGRRCTFAVEAYNEKEKIGEGIHQRVILDRKRLTTTGQ